MCIGNTLRDMAEEAEGLNDAERHSLREIAKVWDERQAEREFLSPRPLLFGGLFAFTVIVNDKVPEGQIWFATQQQIDEALEYSDKQIERLIRESEG